MVVPFVETPLTESVRAAVEGSWALELDGAAIRLHGGEESAAFRIGEVVLRIGPSWRKLPELEWCHAVARAAAASVPQALSPLVNMRGETAVVVDGRPVSTWPFVDGERADDDEDQRSQAAALLAALHRALAGVSLGSRPSRSSPSAYVPEVHDPQLDSWLHDFRCRYPRHHPLHGDFYAGNLLVRDGAIVALLDWDEALVGPPEQELAWAAWEWGDGLWAEDFTEVFEFLDAYHAAEGPASRVAESDLYQLVRARLRQDVQYAVGTDLPGTALDEDEQAYRLRQIDVFQRLLR